VINNSVSFKIKNFDDLKKQQVFLFVGHPKMSSSAVASLITQVRKPNDSESTTTLMRESSSNGLNENDKNNDETVQVEVIQSDSNNSDGDRSSSGGGNSSRSSNSNSNNNNNINYNGNNGNNARNSNGAQAGETQTTKKVSFLRRILCCFHRKPPTESSRSEVKAAATVVQSALLNPLPSDLLGRKTLVLDLDETLVHSSFKPIPNPDFVIPVEIEGQVHKVYVVKRPGVDQFLKEMGEHYEVVVFTASVSKYADPVLDLLDTHRVIRARLFRESCTNYKGNYVKDLTRLGRNIKDALIIDNSPSSFLFQPENAIPCETWFDDENDRELLDFIPLIQGFSRVDDVRVAIEEAKRLGKIK